MTTLWEVWFWWSQVWGAFGAAAVAILGWRMVLDGIRAERPIPSLAKPASTLRLVWHMERRR